MDEPASTFKTEVDFKEVRAAKPVILGNLVALRETFLSEAPFVNRSNKLFWNKWIECNEFVSMMSSAFQFVQNCISESGSVSLDKLNDITHSPSISAMSNNLADMFFLQNPRARDMFFNRLPEILCFMVLTALQISNPKNHRLFNSSRFRELLLDLFNELLCGMRPTDSRRNSEWLFEDTNDSQIMTSNSNMSMSLSQEALQRRSGGNLNKLASAQSTYTIGHSPLIGSHLGVQSQKHPIQNTLKLTLCHLPNRPLICLSDGDMLKNVRERKISQDIILSTVHGGQARRIELKKDYIHSKATLRQDKSNLRESLKINLAVLDNVPVSNKRLVAAALASSSSASVSSGGVGVGGTGLGIAAGSSNSLGTSIMLPSVGRPDASISGKLSAADVGSVGSMSR